MKNLDLFLVNANFKKDNVRALLKKSILYYTIIASASLMLFKWLRKNK